MLIRANGRLDYLRLKNGIEMTIFKIGGLRVSGIGGDSVEVAEWRMRRTLRVGGGLVATVECLKKKMLLTRTEMDKLKNRLLLKENIKAIRRNLKLLLLKPDIGILQRRRLENQLHRDPVTVDEEDELNVMDSFIINVLRGWRLLVAASLGPEEWRDILSATNGRLDYDSISDALQTLWDEQLTATRFLHSLDITFMLRKPIITLRTWRTRPTRTGEMNGEMVGTLVGNIMSVGEMTILLYGNLLESNMEKTLMILDYKNCRRPSRMLRCWPWRRSERGHRLSKPLRL